MEAKDTERHKKELFQIGNKINDFGAEYGLATIEGKTPPDIFEVVESIFELSYKAGIKEVVKWIEDNTSTPLGPDSYGYYIWKATLQAKLKEWEINEES